MKFVYCRDWSQTIIGLVMALWFGGLNVFNFLNLVSGACYGLWLSTLVVAWLCAVLSSGAFLVGLFLFFDGILNPEFKKIKIERVEEK
jgi:hypothetical protein